RGNAGARQYRSRFVDHHTGQISACRVALARRGPHDAQCQRQDSDARRLAHAGNVGVDSTAGARTATLTKSFAMLSRSFAAPEALVRPRCLTEVARPYTVSSLSVINLFAISCRTSADLTGIRADRSF